MRPILILALLGPSLVAETLTVHGEAGPWRFSFQIPTEEYRNGTPALEHSEFQAWYSGQAVPTDHHKLEFTRGPWGYTLSVQPNPSERRFTLFNHTSLGELWFPTEPDVLRLRPGWYRFDHGHTLGLEDSVAVLRIEGAVETSTSESRRSSFIFLVAGLLAGIWTTRCVGRQAIPELAAADVAGPEQG